MVGSSRVQTGQSGQSACFVGPYLRTVFCDTMIATCLSESLAGPSVGSPGMKGWEGFLALCLDDRRDSRRKKHFGELYLQQSRLADGNCKHDDGEMRCFLRRYPFERRELHE